MSEMLPTVEQATEACDYMATRVHAPAFFEKLAEFNIAPRNDAEAAQMLQLGAMLHQAEIDGQYKTAADAMNEAENPFLAQALGQFVPGDTALGSVKEAALAAVNEDDLVKAAALVYGHVVSGGDVAESEQPEE